MLWLSLASIVTLQILAVHWAPASSVFATVALSATDWAVAVMVSSSILIIEEARKLLLALTKLKPFARPNPNQHKP